MSYHPLISVTHWIMVGLLSWLIWGGLVLDSLDFSAAVAQRYSLHKSIGMLAFLLALMRLALRFIFKTPGHESNWRGVASLWVQRALYALMIIYPLSGYLFHSASKGIKVPVTFFGWRMPDLSIGGEIFWQEVHHSCLPVLGIVLSVHVLGALFHLLRRDGMFRRILPF